MAEYIDRADLIKNLKKFAPEHYTSLIDQLITKQPTADVVEVKHGEWIDTGDEILDTTYSGWKCSECGYIFCGNKFKFCPECGAKMDGGKAE